MSKKILKKDPHYLRESEKYENPVPSREYIMQALEEMGKPVSNKKIIEYFAIRKEDQREAMRRRLIAMERDGQLMRNRRGSYALVNQLELIRGRVVGNKEGFGFLIPDDKSEHIYLSPYQMRSLFPNDTVLVRVAGVNQRGKREGIVVEMLERKTHSLVGRYFEEKNIAFVQPDKKLITQDILIPPGEEGKAKHGQYVVIEIVSQPSTRRQATGRVIEILGDHLSPGMEIEVAIRAHDIPHDWPEDVLREIAIWSAEIPESAKQNRTDIRDLPLVTIDGEDAKDFDDAVYARYDGKKGWTLYVAIADVSYYVHPNSALDKEAFIRGNSVYFPGRVIPMLPEILSNELCSLKPYVDRLCMVCEMQIDLKGKLINYTFYDAVMRSRARLTYDEVAAMLKGDKKSKMALLPDLKNLQALYEKLRKQRTERGALDFETTETRIVFGKNKKIKEVVPVQRNEAHKIIEECMLIANVATANFLNDAKLPALYRVHEGPNPEKMTNLQDFLKGVGLRLGGGESPQPKDYAKLIDRIAGRVDANLIQTVLLRSLMQAIYTPINKGHFGLAYDTYAHFTSPIRRYPDLLVHRAIRHAIKSKQPTKAEYTYSQENMAFYGEHCSMTERRADDATRDAVSWLKCYYMQDKLGKEFEGIITGVTGFGVFVQLNHIFVEGLVHITSLKNDYYHFDPAQHCLKGKHAGKIYRLGDQLRVLVARVDLDEKQIDFELVK